MHATFRWEDSMIYSVRWLAALAILLIPAVAACAEPTATPTRTWTETSLRIAFSSARDGNYEVYVMNADGSGQTRLTDDPSGDTFPSWFIQSVPEPTSN